MCPVDPDWRKLHRLCVGKIAELAAGFMRRIRTAQGEIPDGDSGGFATFCLAQDDSAERWVGAMRSACIDHFQAEAQSVSEHSNFWPFLYAISKEMALHIKELLHVSFGITARDIELFERCRNLSGDSHLKFMRSDGVGTWVFKTPRIEHAWENACAKISAVEEIMQRLFGIEKPFESEPKRKLAFGTPDAPKFEMPVAHQITGNVDEIEIHPNATKRRSRKKRLRTDKRPKIRSTFRQHVFHYLIDHPEASSAKDVCIWCDQQDIVGPKSWYTDAGDQRELWTIYNNNPVIRGRVDKYVSDVRRSIRKRL